MGSWLMLRRRKVLEGEPGSAEWGHGADVWASLQQLDAGQDSDRAGPEEEPCLETAPLVQMLNTELQLLLNLLTDRTQRHARARLRSGALTGSDAY